jgi:hypothetical protein
LESKFYKCYRKTQFLCQNLSSGKTELPDAKKTEFRFFAEEKKENLTDLNRDCCSARPVSIGLMKKPFTPGYDNVFCLS